MANRKSISHSRWLWLASALLMVALPAGAHDAPAAASSEQKSAHNHHQAESKADSDRTSQQPGQNVITIRYQCAGKPDAADETCTVTVSKSEFDALVAAINPKMTSANRQSLAEEYSRLLIMAAEARRRGVDQSAEFATLMNFSKLQLLATRLVGEITANAPAVSSQAVEKHFLDHALDYEEVVVSRIFVPSPPSSMVSGRAPAESSVQRVHARAMKGEDFASLQRELNPGTLEPNVRIGPGRCHALPQAHRQVCRLAPGSISAPLPDQGGHAIYRLESRHRPKLSAVREEIRIMLERKSLEQEIHKTRTPVSLVLDEAYFGKLPSPEVAIEHGIQNPTAGSPSPKAAHKHHQH
jgi:hypothetical protein